MLYFFIDTYCLAFYKITTLYTSCFSGVKLVSRTNYEFFRKIMFLD
jgi:hypothetical protein